MLAPDDEPLLPQPDARGASIPTDWLCEPVDLHELEEELSNEWMPDYWLDRWRALLGRRNPGDELWSYWGRECGPEGESGEWQQGYALVRDGAIIDSIGRYPW